MIFEPEVKEWEQLICLFCEEEMTKTSLKWDDEIHAMFDCPYGCSFFDRKNQLGTWCFPNIEGGSRLFTTEEAKRVLKLRSFQ